MAEMKFPLNVKDALTGLADGVGGDMADGLQVDLFGGHAALLTEIYLIQRNLVYQNQGLSKLKDRSKFMVSSRLPISPIDSAVMEAGEVHSRWKWSRGSPR